LFGDIHKPRSFGEEDRNDIKIRTETRFRSACIILLMRKVKIEGIIEIRC